MSTATPQPKCTYTPISGPVFYCEDCRKEMVNEKFLRVPSKGTGIDEKSHPNLYRLLTDMICQPCGLRRRLEGQL